MDLRLPLPLHFCTILLLKNTCSMHIVAFGASYSSASINRQFAAWAAARFENSTADLLDLNEYELPVFTVDREQTEGHPEAAHRFVEKIRSADLLIISLAEHNGTYTAAFKILFDWSSRVQLKMFEGKTMFLLSTAPGARGGLGVMEAARVRFPIHGAEIAGHFSLPKFGEHFDPAHGITDPDLRAAFELQEALVKSRMAEKA